MQRRKSKLIEACQSWKARRRWNSQLIKRQFLSIIRRAGRKGLAGWHGSKLGATKDIKKRESKQNATKRKRKTNTHEWGFPLVCSSLLLDQTKINSGQIFIYSPFFLGSAKGQAFAICLRLRLGFHLTWLAVQRLGDSCSWFRFEVSATTALSCQVPLRPMCVCAPAKRSFQWGILPIFFCSTVAGQGKSSIKSITGRLVKFLCG